MIRAQPDGEDEENDELDPRVEIELENLNKASNDINILEKELDEARAVFRQSLTDATRNLNHLSKRLGNNIDKARPYFEARNQAKKAHLECQNAAMTFERASQLHKGARETISVAEEKLKLNPGMFDAAWQEMLNNANFKILEAEKEKLKHELQHQEAAITYTELEQRAVHLEKQLKKNINKARPYFEQKAQYMDFLETQKVKVQELEKQYASAKHKYSASLRKLEVISEDIHRKRNKGLADHCNSAPTTKREECVGAETPDISRRKSLERKQSEERIRQALSRHKRPTGKYRSSLLLDLDIDFDIDDIVDYAEPTKSPSSKSVDMGCISMKYYDDYQVLDVKPFLEMERRMSLTGRHHSTTIDDSESEVQNISTVRKDVLLTADKDQLESHPRSISTSSSESFEALHHKSRSSTVNSEFEVLHPHALDVTSPTQRKESKAVLVTRFAMIEELDGDDVSIDALDNIEPHDNDNSIEGVEEGVYNLKEEIKQECVAEENREEKTNVDDTKDLCDCLSEEIEDEVEHTEDILDVERNFNETNHSGTNLEDVPKSGESESENADIKSDDKGDAEELDNDVQTTLKSDEEKDNTHERSDDEINEDDVS